MRPSQTGRGSSTTTRTGPGSHAASTTRPLAAREQQQTTAEQSDVGRLRAIAVAHTSATSTTGPIDATVRDWNFVSTRRSIATASSAPTRNSSGARVGAVVRVVDTAADHEPTVDERYRRERANAHRSGPCGAAARHASTATITGASTQVELLLDRERPVVLQRRRRREQVRRTPAPTARKRQFATSPSAARRRRGSSARSAPSCRRDRDARRRQDAASAAGKQPADPARRRTRPSDTRPRRLPTRDRIRPVMRKPDSVKNVETPRKPPWSRSSWNASTATSASARTPSRPGS